MKINPQPILKKFSSDDRNLIEKAYSFAFSAHQDQKRRSGDPYITHTVAVAKKVADLNLDAKAVAAALLHDVVEDTRYDHNTIKKEFGQEVANLVDGLTKLDNVRIKRKWLLFGPQIKEEIPRSERQIETLRKLFLATTKDLRVIIIKLADRLHNTQTLSGLEAQKRKQFAMETLKLFAPVAYRLGMNDLKGRLEDLAFPYAYPKAYQDIRKMSGPTYEQCEVIATEMQKRLKKVLNQNKISAQLDGRPKYRYSLWRKLQNYRNDISKIYDLVAVRVVVKDIETCYKALDIIHQNFQPMAQRIKDYIEHPKPNGYQSLHTTVYGPNNQPIEIQIRTQKMHDQAEYGVAAHWRYKEVKDAKSANVETAWLSEVATVGKRLKDPKELASHLEVEFFGDRIFPVTPDGDIIDLPAGATALDFAYRIHSELGGHATGAKVNGKMSKLSSELKNGDQVEILTQRRAKPSQDWLSFVKTPNARNRIRKALRLKGLIPAVLRRR